MKQLPAIALGAWGWGSADTFGSTPDKETLREVFETAMKEELNLWDTAYVYGFGKAELILAEFLKESPRESWVLSDKFTPRCADMSSRTPLKDMLEMQLEHMGINKFDIYWIHNASDAPRWTTELAEYYEGRADAPLIGVSNHDMEQIRQAESILKEHGLKLSAVQNHFSLLNRFSESAGILDYCREKGIPFFSYMVLEQGALSGKYDMQHPMPAGSARAEVYNPILPKLESLNEALLQMADHYSVSPAQIPVAWAISKGTIPIVGVTKPSHVEDAAKAITVQLASEDIEQLERLADALNLDVNRFWERQMK